MHFSWDEFRKNKSGIEEIRQAKRLWLPPEEYAEVISEINTHMSEEDRNRSLVTKPIGNYYYTFINRGFDDYIIIAKRPIISIVEEDWEDNK